MSDAETKPTLAVVPIVERAKSLADLFEAFEVGIGLKPDETRKRARVVLARAFVIGTSAPNLKMASELYVALVERAAGKG